MDNDISVTVSVPMGLGAPFQSEHEPEPEPELDHVIQWGATRDTNTTPIGAWGKQKIILLASLTVALSTICLA